MLTRVGRWGYGAWAVREDELLLMAGEWTGEQRDGMIIAEKELLASTLALRTLGPLLGADCIFEFTDSTVALAAMVSLTRRHWRACSGLYSSDCCWRSSTGGG